MIEDAVSAYIYDERISADPNACTWLYHTLELACIAEFEGISDILQVLKDDGVKLAVLSNADPSKTEKRLAELDLTKYFDLIVTPDTFGVKKPNPLVYKMTLNHLGVSADETVMIGDKKRRDVFPPRELGIFSIHAAYGSMETDDKECAVIKPAELQNILKMRVV